MITENKPTQDPINLSLKELVASDLPAPIQTETKDDGFVALPSSSLQAYRYDDATETLYIRFKNGVYEYFDVPEKVVEMMLEAKSIGSFFYYNIRAIYNYALSKKYKVKGTKRTIKEDRYQEIFETQKQLKALLPKLKGEYFEDDKTLTYDHIVGTDSPNTAEYTKMFWAAKADEKILKQNKIAYSFNDGNGRNDIGLPYIDINDDPHASAYMKESEGEETDDLEDTKSNDAAYKKAFDSMDDEKYYDTLMRELSELIDEQVYQLYINYKGDKSKLYPLIDDLEVLFAQSEEDEEAEEVLMIESSPEFQALCDAMNENNTLNENAEPAITDENQTFYFTSSAKDILGIKGLEHPTAQGLAVEILSKFREEFQSALDAADISQYFIMTLEFKNKEEMPNAELQGEELNDDNPLEENKKLEEWVNQSVFEERLPEITTRAKKMKVKDFNMLVNTNQSLTNNQLVQLAMKLGIEVPKQDLNRYNKQTKVNPTVA